MPFRAAATIIRSTSSSVIGGGEGAERSDVEVNDSSKNCCAPVGRAGEMITSDPEGTSLSCFGFDIAAASFADVLWSVAEDIHADASETPRADAHEENRPIHDLSCLFEFASVDILSASNVGLRHEQRPLPLVHFWRLTMASIQIGANGDVQPFETG